MWKHCCIAWTAFVLSFATSNAHAQQRPQKIHRPLYPVEDNKAGFWSPTIGWRIVGRFYHLVNEAAESGWPVTSPWSVRAVVAIKLTLTN